jgi:hypothetical protein
MQRDEINIIKLLEKEKLFSAFLQERTSQAFLLSLRSTRFALYDF